MKSLLYTVALWLSTAARGARADWQYRSRPDLSPPRLNITVPAGDGIAPGYIFVGPYPGVGGGPEQPAAYIFRNDGDLVWSGLGYLAGWAANIQVAEYQGRPVLQAFQGSVDVSHGHGFGSAVLLDQHYRQIEVVRSPTNKLLDLHEFRIVDGKTALVEIYQPIPYDLRPYGGADGQQWIVDGIIQEIDIETGELIFERHTLDIVEPADSLHPLTGFNSTDAWDYFHINSVDKDDEGNYLISGRHTSAIYKLDGRTGSVIWQLGGARSSFTFDPPTTTTKRPFGLQHDARFLSRSPDGNIETISLFDNGDGVGGSPSAARVYRLDHAARAAAEVRAYPAPDGLWAASQGNAQVLPLPGGGAGNGNVFVNWGSAGAVTEFAPGGEVLFHAYLDSGPGGRTAQSYRGFRFEWEGRSGETPAVVAVRDPKTGEAAIYVSWNGDTVTKSWRFYVRGAAAGSKGSKTSSLGRVPRTSFETVLRVSPSEIDRVGKGARVFAEAIDHHGVVLSRSEPVVIKEAIEPLRGSGFRDRGTQQSVLQEFEVADFTDL
ncbi:ASST-domain-containing protein [Phialemonium atrogriseum]|uniref:ASST-domain-containing protein n=1 Tax=Phialemonium atrogriseum TaxID=1093897 RepID=A0AAJ0C356_9PEZI|nr:ASST-domain-containing protein [Phialemonium atrogriseum]KAK1767869.1 ASST-domain-containing protein [Phialemonium atrogriseum]